MRSAPTAAVGVLLGGPSLNVMIKAEAQAGIYRLMCNQQWKPESTNLVVLQNLGTWGIVLYCIFVFISLSIDPIQGYKTHGYRNSQKLHLYIQSTTSNCLIR
jgi:hypothetical protein